MPIEIEEGSSLLKSVTRIAVNAKGDKIAGSCGRVMKKFLPFMSGIYTTAPGLMPQAKEEIIFSMLMKITTHTSRTKDVVTKKISQILLHS